MPQHLVEVVEYLCVILGLKELSVHMQAVTTGPWIYTEAEMGVANCLNSIWTLNTWVQARDQAEKAISVAKKKQNEDTLSILRIF